MLTDCAEIGKPYAFTIDASKAGNGKLEIFVSVDEREVLIDTIVSLFFVNYKFEYLKILFKFFKEENKGKFKIKFTPQEKNDHIISVKFNEIPILGIIF